MNIWVSYLFILCGWGMIWSQARVMTWSPEFWIIIVGGIFIQAGGALMIVLSDSKP